MISYKERCECLRCENKKICCYIPCEKCTVPKDLLKFGCNKWKRRDVDAR